MTSLAASLAIQDRFARLRASLASMSERDWLCWSLYGVWALFTAWVYLNASAVSFDERWFLKDTRPITPVGALAAGAHLGYGQLYWVLLTAMPSALAARLVWLGFYLATPLMVALSAERRMRIYVIGAWLAMPAAWWYGKIIGPEIPNLFLAALAMALLMRGRLVWAGFVIGAAIGIKVLAAPLVLIFLWPLIEAPRRNFPVLMKAAGASLLGFIFINPGLLLNPAHILGQILFASGAKNTEWTQIFDILSNAHMQWDMVQTGGLAQFIMPAPFLLALFVNARMTGTPAPLMAAAGISLLAFLAIFMIPDRFLGWYWLPALPIVLMLIGAAERAGRILIPLIVASLVFNLPVISISVHEKIDQIRITSNGAAISACLATALEDELVTDILDHSEFGGLDRPDIPGDYIQYRGLWDGNWSHLFLGQRMIGSEVGRQILGVPDMYMIRDCKGVMVFRRETIRQRLLAGEEA